LDLHSPALRSLPLPICGCRCLLLTVTRCHGLGFLRDAADPFLIPPVLTPYIDVARTLGRPTFIPFLVDTSFFRQAYFAGGVGRFFLGFLVFVGFSLSFPFGPVVNLL